MPRLKVMCLSLIFTAGCRFAVLPKALFACEANGTCRQPGMVCEADFICRTPSEADSGAPDLDAGVLDAGTHCIDTDEPDDVYQPGVDTNCDGIDGDLSLAALVDTVTGDDVGGTGSRLKPYKTIGRALATLKLQILVSAGTYTEDLSITQGRIFGGYDQSASWARTAPRPVIIGHVEMLGANKPMQLDFVKIISAAPNDAGTSVALIITGVDAGTIVRRSVLHANAGQPGQAGTSGASGSAGTDGQPGLSGDAGGLGGAQVLSGCPDAPLSAAGGAGGTGARIDGPGDDGSPRLRGGDGGVATTCTMLPCLGASGGDGLAGEDGAPGSGGDAAPVGTFVDALWVSGVGANGSNGAPGFGGGGAGGGGSAYDSVGLLLSLGGGGGSGGSGGCPGAGGQGGTGGGASVALLLVNAAPTLEANTFEADVGGRGGDGAPGTFGGPGGNGGTGGAGQSDPSGLAGGQGGQGGRGGQGGLGGRGGGGAGGPSVGLWCTSNAAPVLVGSSNSFLVSDAGVGGAPNGLTGSSASTYHCP